MTKSATQVVQPVKAQAPAENTLQRKCDCGNHTMGAASCDDCKKALQDNKGILQRRGTSAPTNDVPSIVQDVLNTPGKPLDFEVRAKAQQRMRHDFSSVRVHSDARAAESAKAVHALAYTVGNHLVFAAGHHKPQTPIGQNLLMHELAHVVQQSREASVSKHGSGIRIDESGEADADKMIQSREFQSSPRVRIPYGVMQRQAAGTAATCAKTYTKAASFRGLIDLVRAAEAKMKAAGITGQGEQIKTLRGIYYGTTWSMDFNKEKSVGRNVGFQAFTQSLTDPTNPTTIFDCGLFDALIQSAEVSDKGKRVDFGHLIIGLEARNSALPGVPFPTFGGTGTEIVTWLGDLGGGAGSLAKDRATTPTTSVSRKFSGSDYGGSVNLEGDVAGYVVARGGQTSLVAPVIPSGKSVADALEDYLAPAKPNSEWADRAKIFVTMLGGTVDATGNITNKATLTTVNAKKIETFACQYLARRAMDGKISEKELIGATDHVIPASEEVSETFFTALEDSAKGGSKIAATKFPTPKPAVPGACSTVMRARRVAKAASEALDEAKKTWERYKPW